MTWSAVQQQQQDSFRAILSMLLFFLFIYSAVLFLHSEEKQFLFPLDLERKHWREKVE